MIATIRNACTALLLAALPASAAQAAGPDFACRNDKAEVTCTAAGCDVNADGFTSMAVSLSGSELQVCAYSGCQSGPVDLRRTRGDLLIVHAKVGGTVGPAVVAYDRKQRIATLLWGSYALPMSCGTPQG